MRDFHLFCRVSVTSARISRERMRSLLLAVLLFLGTVHLSRSLLTRYAHPVFSSTPSRVFLDPEGGSVIATNIIVLLLLFIVIITF